MVVRQIALASLLINRANDRHGELENETAAIAWLFNTREQHMRNLTRDIVQQGEIFELPLVWPQDDKFIVFDGNRRVTCLKLLQNPHRAPTIDLQAFFQEQRALARKVSGKDWLPRRRRPRPYRRNSLSSPHRFASRCRSERLGRPDEGDVRRTHRQRRSS